MVLGSEGRLGVITEATVQVRRVPERADPRLPVPDLGRRPGRDAGHRRERGRAVGHARLRRAETAFSFATRKAPTVARSRQVQGATTYLRRRRASTWRRCACRSSATRAASDHVAGQRKARRADRRRHGGLCIGASPGELYDQKKFDTPYIRDFLLDRGALADVSETSAPWSAAERVYDAVMAAGHGAFRLGVPRLHHVPPVALLPLRAPACTSHSRSIPPTNATAWRTTAS